GASEGGLRGAGQGIRTAQEVLDIPYQKAMRSYDLQGKALEKGAEVESRNLGRAAGFARSAVMSDDAMMKAADLRDYHEKYLGVLGERNKALALRAGGNIHWTTGSADGKVHGFKVNPEDNT